MPQRWTKIILSLLAAPLLFASCKKQFSSDQSLPTNYTPTIVISSDNQVVYAIDPTTGFKAWQFSLPALPGTPNVYFAPSPLLYGNRIYLTTIANDTIYKLNAETGVLVKKIVITHAGNFRVQATPVADANLLYIATDNDTLYAIDTGTYATKWMFGASGPLYSSPTVYNGQVYFASLTGGAGGTVYCVDKTIGPAAGDIPTWSYTPPATSGFPSFVSSPAISAPYLYIGNLTDSSMYCIYLTSSTPSGVLRWTYKTNGAIKSSPAANNGVCVFGSTDFKVYCLDTFLVGANTSPHARWIDSTHADVVSSPVIVNQVVYVASYDYNLYAYNIIDGSTRWNFATTALVKSSPLVYQNTVYIGSYDKNLYAVDTATGTMKWNFNLNGQIEGCPVINDLSGINQSNSQISGFTN